MEKLHNILLMIIPMIIGSVLYLGIDSKYNLTEKISSKMKIDKKWQPFCVFCTMLVLGVFLAMVDTPRWVLGFVMGVTINGIGVKMNCMITK